MKDNIEILEDKEIKDNIKKEDNKFIHKEYIYVVSLFILSIVALVYMFITIK